MGDWLDEWFTVNRVDDQTFGISEYGHPEQAHSWLCIGDQRALLIDTGLGIGRISDEVARLTDKPVTVVATHVHWDHIGGHAEFSEFYVHHREMGWVSGGFPLSNEQVKQQLAKGWDIPAGFDLDAYQVFAGTPTRVLDGGEVIDIGGRVFDVIHTPGHSPGHMCLSEPERGYLFTGDLVYCGTLFANYPSTDPVAYLASLQSIAKLSARRLLPGHHSLDIPHTMVMNVRDAFMCLSNQGLLQHGTGEHQYDGFTIRL